ncbi:MAG: RluA family pseudouridine synthase [Bacteroidales bacterium]|nr:RluA family pseudouridine synthase [Bacteroidales bacterium]
MEENQSSFKKPSKKHQPNGLSILYEDRDILVVDKAAGLLTIGTDREKQKTAHFLLNEYVKKGSERSRNRVFIVHRLDRDTSGILVFAKSENAKHYLQDHWQDFSKTYFAVVHGKLKDKEGEITSYLTENRAYRVYSVNNPDKGKFAKTGYKVVKESDQYSLLEITLFTGRKNQIRVHMSEMGHPVAGDKIYGMQDKGIRRLALHSASLTIIHPFTHKEMSFKTEIPPYFNTLVKS